MESLNLDNLTVDSSGRASFSGLASGIDFEATIEAIITAKRIPVVTLENRISDNEAKLAAIDDLRALLDTVKSAVAPLRGAVSVDGTGDIFKNKQVFAATSRLDGQTPSAAGNLIGVTVTNAAAPGSHEIEVRRVATAHKISSNAFTSQSTALGISGTFTIGNGTSDATISVASTDSLLDIRDRINNANTGATATGVTASVVQVSSSENFLIITNDDTGEELLISDTGSALSDLGLSTTNGNGAFRNGLASGTADNQSKIDTADGFKSILFDGTQADRAFLVTYDSATRALTLTRDDGTSESVTLASGTIANGATETATFESFGATIIVDDTFDKGADIVVDAATATVTGGTGALTDSTIAISGSTGDISGITSTTLTLGNLATPSALTLTAGAFSGTFDGSTTGAKSVTLSDGSGNSLTVDFTVASAFDGTETAATIDLEDLENAVGATGTRYTNQLQRAQTARFTADGLSDGTHFESRVLVSDSVALTNFTSTATFPGTFDIVGTATRTISYTSTDTLASLRDKINAEQSLTGVSAKIVSDGAGVRLDLDASAAFTLTDTSGLVADLDINDALVVERNDNTVDDVFSGITLSLFQAEPGTTVKIDIERDLAAVKTAIEDFVTAYNAVRVFINTQNQADPNTGTKGENSGALFGNAVMNDIRDQLANIVGLGTAGVSTAFTVLAQIGVELVDNASLTDPLQADTLEIDSTKLDEVLLSNVDDVRRLFAFDFSASDPSVVLVDFTAATSFSASGYTLNIGTIGQFDQNTTTVSDRTATLDQSTSAGATVTGSQSFTINGQAVSYDITTDTLETLATTITNAGINGVSATVVDDSTGAHLAVHSAVDPLTIGGDTGDLLAKLAFTPDPDEIDSANIDGAASGADDGTVTVSGRTLTVTDASGAEGLKLFYTGAANTAGLTLDFTIGLGAQTFFALESFLDDATGALQGETAAIEGQNLLAEERITSMETRIDILRESLTQRFIAAEQAIASMNTVIDSIRQTFDALTANA